MKHFLTIFILIVMLIQCASKDNLVVPTCDTCSHHTDTSGSKTDTTKTALDTVPVSIAILSGDSTFFEKLSSAGPVSLAVVVKNKEGNFIKGVPVVFSAGLNSGSLNHDTTSTDMQGAAYAVWTLNPQTDTGQVMAKVVYKNTNLFVTFHATLAHDTLYNYTGTLTMDSTNMPGGGFIGFTDTTNAPDPFTIASDSMALANGISYPFELDGMMKPTFQPGEHGVAGTAMMTINQILYPRVQVNYEVGGLTIVEVTTTRTFTNPEPCTVTMYWQLRGGDAYLLETVSSPTKGTFTNGRTGKIVITSTQTVLH